MMSTLAESAPRENPVVRRAIFFQPVSLCDQKLCNYFELLAWYPTDFDTAEYVYSALPQDWQAVHSAQKIHQELQLVRQRHDPLKGVLGLEERVAEVLGGLDPPPPPRDTAITQDQQGR
jgi:hypothetical protein